MALCVHYKIEQKNEMVAIRRWGVNRSHGSMHTRLESNRLIIVMQNSMMNLNNCIQYGPKREGVWERRMEIKGSETIKVEVIVYESESIKFIKGNLLRPT